MARVGTTSIPDFRPPVSGPGAAAFVLCLIAGAALTGILQNPTWLIAGIVVSVVISAGVWALAVGLPWKVGTSETALSAFVQWIYHTQSSTGIRESIWVFPIIEGTHLLGIALSAGRCVGSISGCWVSRSATSAYPSCGNT